MNNRINDKIQEIEKYLRELESFFPIDFKEYKNNFKTKAVCERYFEKIIEAVVDLAFLIIRQKEFSVPEDDKNAFEILFRENIISEDLSEKLKSAKGMRNIIAHEYGKIDDSLVFESVTEELIKDVESFINKVGEVK